MNNEIALKFMNIADSLQIVPLFSIEKQSSLNVLIWKSPMFSNSSPSFFYKKSLKIKSNSKSWYEFLKKLIYY